jgi:hypothetical protein
MEIENVVIAGILTDQCVFSTVRSLADEGFKFVVVEDCCAAATMELHEKEIEIINVIYYHVAKLDEVVGFFAGALGRRFCVSAPSVEKVRKTREQPALAVTYSRPSLAARCDAVH